MKKFLISLGLIYAIALLGNRIDLTYADASGEAIICTGTFASLKNNQLVSDISIPEKAWYKNGIGITEMAGIFINESSTGVKTTNITTVGYLFVDIQKRWVYEYANFSDTAKVLRKYYFSDTTPSAGGWNFIRRSPFSGHHISKEVYYQKYYALNPCWHSHKWVNNKTGKTKYYIIEKNQCDKQDEYTYISFRNIWMRLPVGILFFNIP